MSALIGVTWILEAASTEALVDEIVPEGARVTVRFEDDDTAGGSAGCDSFAGSYTRGDDGSISIEAGGMTQMACEEPLRRLESAYVAALGEVTSFEAIDEGAGLVLSGAETPLSYIAEQPLALEGTAWAADGIAIGNDAVSSTIAGTEAGIVLEGGAVTGDTGCNRLTGSYTSEGDASSGSISFSEIATTTMLCEPGVADQEAAILIGLDGASSYSIEGSTLSLTDADGVFLLSLVGS